MARPATPALATAAEGSAGGTSFPSDTAPTQQPLASGCTAPLPSDLQAWLDQQEREILIRALKESGFNRTATAARLGISLRQIRYRIARLNIAVPNDQDPHDDQG